MSLAILLCALRDIDFLTAKRFLILNGQTMVKVHEKFHNKGCENVFFKTRGAPLM